MEEGDIPIVGVFGWCGICKNVLRVSTGIDFTITDGTLKDRCPKCGSLLLNLGESLCPHGMIPVWLEEPA